MPIRAHNDMQTGIAMSVSASLRAVHDKCGLIPVGAQANVLALS